MKQNRITKAARGRDCQVRIPGHCNGNPETVVLAHYRMAGTCGTGYKPNDLQAAWACSGCHDAIDGRTDVPWGFEDLLRALLKTQVRLHAKGLLLLKKMGKARDAE